MPEQLIDAQAVADLMLVPVSWVRDATRDGRLPCVRLGKYVRYRRSTVEAWLVEQEEAAPRRRLGYDRPRANRGR